jgi:hypothetical protein
LKKVWADRPTAVRFRVKKNHVIGELLAVIKHLVIGELLAVIKNLVIET